MQGKTANDSDDDTVLLSEVKGEKKKRLRTGPWDPVFGGGLVIGSSNLLGGEPGAGKSTLTLQILEEIVKPFAKKGLPGAEAFYIGAEEAGKDILDRALRLELLHFSRVRLMPRGSQSDMGAMLRKHKPRVTVFDSLQAFTKDPADAIEMAHAIKDYSVAGDMVSIIINHVTKGGDFAGFEALQHYVDGTFMMKKVGEKELREFVSIKNRNGAADVSLPLQMTPTGLRVLGKRELERMQADDDDE